MDPTALAFLNAGSNVLGSIFGKKASTPNYSAASNTSFFDSSGWTVATGHASANGGATAASSNPLFIVVALIAFVAWVKHQ